MNTTAHDRASALLATTPLVDGHNDLPWALRALAGPDPADAVDGIDLTAVQPRLQTDLPRLRAGRVGAQFWSVYVPCSFTGDSAVTATLEQIEVVHRLVERYPEHLALVRTADEAEAVFRDGRIASLLGAEGGHSIAGSLGALRALRRLGVRYLTLTHNLNTDWADSATDEPVHGGLTDFGREVVREMNRIGMLVDLSHVAATTMRDALATTSAPVVFTHSSCRAVNDHPRNVPDDVLEALPGNGGVCMVTFVPRFVSPAVAAWDGRLHEAMTAAGLDHRDLRARDAFAAAWDGPPPPTATLDDVVAHLEHAREVAGIDHIGIGGDYDGAAELPAGLEDVAGYPALFGALLERGWSAEDCARLAGRNVLRVLRAADDVARAAGG
ncbi:dipeptidase [Pseudonocardia acidicola]|uniref:Membrane dipeptidase n=1 Tax=Pseudonocardia acidicola TaxID=2724939 RepID=A0ABX1SIY4_9PSEU|nr:dipeptidase [Pseudonocardia acidicola]NMI01026.1 membrane dipeptidase [Pseudonocardia acidicola]